MLTDNELQEIRERCERATEGPWELHDSCSWRRIGTPGHDGKIFSPFVNRYDGHPDISGLEEDFEFIVNARTDVPKLLDEIKRLTAEIEHLRKEIPLIARPAPLIFCHDCPKADDIKTRLKAQLAQKGSDAD